MPGTSVSIPRAAWLLVRLRARRTLNRLLAQGWRRKGPPPLGQPPPRAGTPQKRRSSWLFALFFGVYMPFLAWKQADQVLSVIGKRQLGVGMWTRADALPTAVLHDLSIEAAILILVALVAALANRELSTPEWDLEWLATLPIPSPALFAIRVLERTLINPIGLIVFGAFTSAIAWRSGFGAAIPLVAAAATAALLLIVAAAWTLSDTALRLALAPPKLRNIQALLSVALVLMMIVAVAPVTGVLGPIDYIAAHLPALATTGPAALAVRALTRTHGADVVAPLARLGFEALAAAALAVAALVRIARAGVISGSGRESGRRPRFGPRAPVIAVASAAIGFAEEPAGLAEVRARRSLWPTPLQRRDLRLLTRDRSFLVQTLLLPAVIVAAQLYFRTRAIHGAVAVRSNPANVAAAAFGISAYAGDVLGVPVPQHRGPGALDPLHPAAPAGAIAHPPESEALGQHFADLSHRDPHRLVPARRTHLARRRARRHRDRGRAHLRHHRDRAQCLRERSAGPDHCSGGCVSATRISTWRSRASSLTRSTPTTPGRKGCSSCSPPSWRSRCGRRRATSCPSCSTPPRRPARASRWPTE